MSEYEVGEFARSKAGHDKNELFVIVKVEGEYVYLSDGKLRKIDKPKKKKMKHIQKINFIDNNIKKIIIENDVLRDEIIKKSIKDYNKF